VEIFLSLQKEQSKNMECNVLKDILSALRAIKLLPARTGACPQKRHKSIFMITVPVVGPM